VPISSSKGYNDKTCVLDASTPILGLSNDSYVAYWAAKKMPKITSVAKHIGTLPPSLVSQIVDGIAKSPQTPTWFRDAIFPPKLRRILKPD
ncbi:MAG: hypothetical protein ACREDI_00765, partial [Roseiarcus sp.]